MIAARKVHSGGYSPATAERCSLCGGTFGRRGVWYRSRQRVCHTCWQWGELIEAQEAVDNIGDSVGSLAFTLWLCAASAAVWVGLGWLVLWVVG